MVRTLAHRADTISSDQSSLQTERNHLNDVFTNCQYPDWALKKGFQPKRARVQPEQQEETKGFVAIPCVKGVREPISRILNDAGLRVAMKPHRPVRQLLGNPKDKDDRLNKAGVVYKICCEDYEATYILLKKS